MTVGTQSFFSARGFAKGGAMQNTKVDKYDVQKVDVQERDMQKVDVQNVDVQDVDAQQVDMQEVDVKNIGHRDSRLAKLEWLGGSRFAKCWLAENRLVECRFTAGRRGEYQ